MTSVYKNSSEILQEFLDDYKSITGIELTPNDLGREEVIKFRSQAIMFSAQRAEMQRIRDDIWPQSSSTEGLIKHLASRQLPERFEAQRSSGVLTFTVTAVPATIPAFTLVARDLNGKLYRTTESFSTSDASLIGTVNLQAESVEKGQSENIEVSSGIAFTLEDSITNVEDEVVNATQFRDGRNLESPAEMLERIESHDQRRNSGGNLVAYEEFAREASSQVVTAKALDEPRGPGTVDLIITSGTTDIRQAVENGQAITRLPSAQLVLDVQEFVDQRKPVTDNLQVKAPTETSFDVEFKYELFDEDLRPAVDVEVRKEIEIFIYNVRANELIHPTELERLIDARVGHLIRARRISDFSMSGPSFQNAEDGILIPGTLTIGDFS